MTRITIIAFAATALAGAIGAAPSWGVKFKVRRIGRVRTEACAVADFNNDGRLDVIAGPNLYLAPEFRPVKVRDVTSNVNADGRGYADDFMNLPLDVNGDGRTDVISGGWFSKETCWALETSSHRPHR